MGSIMGFRPNKIITLIAIGGKERDLYKCSIKKQVLLKFIKKRNLRMKHTIKSFKFVIFFFIFAAQTCFHQFMCSVRKRYLHQESSTDFCGM